MSKKAIYVVVLMCLFSGCTHEVQPWQKEELASDAMKKDAGNTLHKQFSEHIYLSKEAAKGGGGVAGGGCGCN